MGAPAPGFEPWTNSPRARAAQAPSGGEHGAGFITITSCSRIASSAQTAPMNARQAGSADIAARRLSRSARLS